MPELPEIALSKKYIDSTSLHDKIVKVEFPQKSLLHNPEKDFHNALMGKKFRETRQLGKYLFLKIEEGSWLVFHFGMTGKLEYYSNQEAPKYTHMIISFDNDYHLAFVCRRKLGKIYLAAGVEEFREEKSFGKDALDLTREEFVELLQQKKGSIKGAITDQHVISGIGNVYADEILYQCEIHPKTKTEKLSEKERETLYRETQTVLKTAINNEGRRSQLPENYLTPHRKEGADCPKCSGKVEMIKVSGRSTYFCPDCQKEKS
ncbi:formamidopyrimidine-DNA glycosylase [Salinimicrobium marinum]|uniref:Formamidopyrimidine-DNA glycosylase n=1 Tax=Salinimicrobium marinum TaxID=680283 RepID=A0A918W038_9FLAO|nr:Fpg/Nei family DNA glycosylase [Salinimicrobium marinum]GHA43706.1 formamidopyrimidine-DNA glycosylase [Salinimicrobium marinum]